MSSHLQLTSTSSIAVSVTGELDVATVPAVEAALRRAEACGADEVVLDLSGLTFIGSAGLRLILEADDRARSAGHRLTLRTGAAVVRTVELAGAARRSRWALPSPGLAD